MDKDERIAKLESDVFDLGLDNVMLAAKVKALEEQNSVLQSKLYTGKPVLAALLREKGT